MTPDVSIIIATYNSERILGKVLRSIKSQTFSQQKIEVILADGGSADNTLDIASKHGCKIIKNPKKNPLHGKFLGYLNTRGKFLMFLDHDEVLETKSSISMKVEVFNTAKTVKAVIPSGYKDPKNSSITTTYINEFGDPFSYFVYSLSKNTTFFLDTMRRRYGFLTENDDYATLSFQNQMKLPIIELGAGGSMIDAQFFKKEFPKTRSDERLLPHLFYLMLQKKGRLAITKEDPVVHYSSSRIKDFLKKIDWRVKNNIYHLRYLGRSGFSGRNKFQPKIYQFKKYLFIPYAFTLLFPLVDSLYLIITRKKLSYIVHIPLSLYTALLILYHFVLSSLGRGKDVGIYGG